MNKDILCHIVSDLLPLYQENLLSEESKKVVEMHIKECETCKKHMNTIELQIDINHTDEKLNENPLKKVKFYQKTLTVLGAVISFFVGACLPIAVLGLEVLRRGEIAVYQLERLKSLWYVPVLNSFAVGIVACGLYFLVVFMIRKRINRNSGDSLWKSVTN